MRSHLGEFFGAVVQAGLASSDGGRRLRPLTSLPPSIAAGQIAGIVACIHLNDPPDLCNQYDSSSLQIARFELMKIPSATSSMSPEVLH